MTSLDIAPRDLETVRTILYEHGPEYEVRVFGSRVRRTARRTSDLDLVLMTHEPVDAQRMGELRDAFSDSDLPFKVDLIDWAVTSEAFRSVIDAECIVLQQPAAAGPTPRR